MITTLIDHPSSADTGTREQMEHLMEFANRVTGGTLRVVAPNA